MGVGAGLYMYDVVIKQFTFAMSSPDELLLNLCENVVIFTCTISTKTRQPTIN